MNLLSSLPAGVRLDEWPVKNKVEVVEDAPEVAKLRQELRHSMPEVVGLLEMMERMQPSRELAARMADPQPMLTSLQRQAN